MKRTFTKYPSSYVKASTSNIKYIQSEWDFAPDDYDYSLPLPKHIGFCGYGGRSWVDINSNGIDTWDSCEEAVEDAKKNYKRGNKIVIYKIDMNTREILERCEEVRT